MIDIIFPSAASIISLSAVALIFGLILSYAKIRLNVEKDPQMEAESVSCDTGMTARVMCRGGKHEAHLKFLYEGPKSCNAAKSLMGGFKVCEYGCLGFGDCQKACPSGAITMAGTQLPVIDRDRCTGCGDCAAECPRHIIKLVKKDIDVHIMCSNRENPAVMRSGCSVGCTGCNLCVKTCAEVFNDNTNIDSAIEVNDFLAGIDYNKCINCLKCAEACPVPVINPLAVAKKFKKNRMS
jgi:ferredoxin